MNVCGSVDPLFYFLREYEQEHQSYLHDQYGKSGIAKEVFSDDYPRKSRDEYPEYGNNGIQRSSPGLLRKYQRYQKEQHYPARLGCMP